MKINVKHPEQSLQAKKKLLVFMQASYYQKKTDRVLERFNDYEITIISRSRVDSTRNVESIYSAKSVFQIIILILKLRKTRFDVLLAAHVDDFFFHLIHKFTNFREFITFDEGLRSLYPDNHYFSKNFADSGQRKHKLLNFLFSFPLPYGRYFDESSTHYAFFDKKLHALKDHKNLILLESFIEGHKDKNKIEKIFIGTSSLWYTSKGINFFDQKLVVKGGSLYNQKLLEAAKRINDLNPDLYLMHPREGNELVGLLNKNIIINKGCLQGNENLINTLNNSNKVKVYTERSGIIFDLDPDIDIIFVNTFDRFNDNYYQEFIDTFNAFRKQQNPKYKGSKKISY